MIRRISVFLAVALLTLTASAQTTIVRNGKARSSIVVMDSDPQTEAAASLLQTMVQRQSGACLEIVHGATPRRGDISIAHDAGIKEDGFCIESTREGISIRGCDKGPVNGVVYLLENKLGIHYWAGYSVDIPQRSTIRINAFKHSDAPAFRYRQTHSWCVKDPVYRQWYSLEDPDEEFIDELWVHTFNRILPAERFGKQHPEWYALINGEHRPGSNSQWCLSNPEVFEAACIQLDSIFKANPDMDMISVSQNDGNNTYCTCPECMKIYEEEGSVSGAYIRFMNKLAERFPDKQISTLAYLFTMDPPQKVKPLPNVNIMLCDIDCKRERPLTDTESGKWFVRALEGWSAISNNIFLWDYGINFDNIVSPFPNFHVLAPNIRLFRDNHVQMHFAQVNGILGGDFTELRAYMIAKLMWNPDAEPEALEIEFLNGYYGAAGPFLKQYLDRITEELLRSDKELWIYDSPITHKNGCLSAELRKEYNALFDAAEEAVKDDQQKLDRVRISRLTLQYSELEIARTETDSDLEKVRADLDLFEQRTSQYGIETLNERDNRPEEYCKLYRERFMPVATVNLAAGKDVRWILEPSGRYAQMAPECLVDGLYGGTTYVESWVGWEGRDAQIIVDLGGQRSFDCIEADFLHQLGAWVLLPKSVRYSVSDDGSEYRDFGHFDFAEDRELKVKFVKGSVCSEAPVSARYVKIDIDTLGLCPDWHYGVGHPAWFFIDEILVYNR